MIEILHKKLVNDFRWLISAMSKISDGTALNYLHADEKYIEACDGHRVNRLTNNYPLIPGFYRVIKCTKFTVMLDQVIDTDGLEWPDTESLFKLCPDMCYTETSDHIRAYAVIVRAIDEDYTFNPDYIKDVFLNSDNFYIAIDWTGRNPVFFISKNKLTAIMPMRL